MLSLEINDAEFELFRQFIYEAAGIHMAPDKRMLVASRLFKRLRHYGLPSYEAYYDLLRRGGAEVERQTAIDLLTTNETYFFREPAHFQHLAEVILSRWEGRRPFRVWSAASSTGEEAYSAAMVLEDRLGSRSWEVVGSDISRRALERAVRAHYAMNRIEGIPPSYLQRYCLRGRGQQEGTMLIVRALRDRVSFLPVALNAPLPQVGTFDVVFLRNALIYFDKPTQRGVLQRVSERLAPGGTLFIGHSESLSGLHEGLEQVAPTIYRKPTERTRGPVGESGGSAVDSAP